MNFYQSKQDYRGIDGQKIQYFYRYFLTKQSKCNKIRTLNSQNNPKWNKDFTHQHKLAQSPPLPPLWPTPAAPPQRSARSSHLNPQYKSLKSHRTQSSNPKNYSQSQSSKPRGDPQAGDRNWVSPVRTLARRPRASADLEAWAAIESESLCPRSERDVSRSEQRQRSSTSRSDARERSSAVWRQEERNPNSAGEMAVLLGSGGGGVDGDAPTIALKLRGEG